MKAIILAATVAASFAFGGLATTSADAAPRHKHGIHTHYKVQKSRVTPRERFAIKRSQAQLARVKAKVYADGRVTPWERVQLKRAQVKHAAAVRKARR